MNKLPLSAIIEAPDALRPAMLKSPEFAQLKVNIATHGILHPLLVRPSKDDPEKYILVDGAQRFACLKELGKTEAPVSVIETDSDEKAYILQISTNACRVKTQPAQYADALYRALMRDPLLSRSKLAEMAGMSLTWLDGILKLTVLSESIKALVDAGKIPLISAQQLVRLPENEREAWLDRATTMSGADFVSTVDARVKEIRAARHQGRDPNAATNFVAIPRIRKLPDLKTAFEDRTVLARITSNATTPEEGALAALAYVLSLDPETVAAARAAHEQSVKQAQEKKAQRAQKSETSKLADAAAVLIKGGLSVDALPDSMRKAYVERQASAETPSA